MSLTGRNPFSTCMRRWRIWRRRTLVARIAEMRYFGGYSEREIADALDITERTVQRDWEKARLILAAALR